MRNYLDSFAGKSPHLLDLSDLPHLSPSKRQLVPLARYCAGMGRFSGTEIFDDLARAFDENCEPFESVAQCDRFIQAATILWRRMGTEQEQGGERFRSVDLQQAIKDARKARAILILSGRGQEVIVPTDTLR